ETLIGSLMCAHLTSWLADFSLQTSPRRYEKRYESPLSEICKVNCLTSPLVRRLPVGAARSISTVLRMKCICQEFSVYSVLRLPAL
ncbi:MAG: hypothetical protein K0Q96_2146, partial [Rubrobacteraceae bacterium]|nr:hypothetical protein [Rubrobacteraceae bacterium]